MVGCNQRARAIKVGAIEFEVAGYVFLIKNNVEKCRQRRMGVLIEPYLHRARFGMVIVRPLLGLSQGYPDHTAIGLVSVVGTGGEVLSCVRQPLVVLFFI